MSAGGASGGDQHDGGAVPDGAAVTAATSPLRHVAFRWLLAARRFLFGLGFDAASEVALLVLAGGAAAFSLPWYAILVIRCCSQPG